MDCRVIQPIVLNRGDWKRDNGPSNDGGVHARQHLPTPHQEMSTTNLQLGKRSCMHIAVGACVAFLKDDTLCPAFAILPSPITESQMI